MTSQGFDLSGRDGESITARVVHIPTATEIDSTKRPTGLDQESMIGAHVNSDGESSSFRL